MTLPEVKFFIAYLRNYINVYVLLLKKSKQVGVSY